jgi:hypothetical protein
MICQFGPHGLDLAKVHEVGCDARIAGARSVGALSAILVPTLKRNAKPKTIDCLLQRLDDLAGACMKVMIGHMINAVLAV